MYASLNRFCQQTSRVEVQGMEQKILEGDDDGQNLLRHDSLGLCLHFSSRTCNHYFSEFFVLVSVRVVIQLHSIRTLMSF